jgi:hypothetical protein
VQEPATPFFATFSKSPGGEAALAAAAGKLAEAALSAAARITRRLGAFRRSNKRFMSSLLWTKAEGVSPRCHYTHVPANVDDITTLNSFRWTGETTLGAG